MSVIDDAIGAAPEAARDRMALVRQIVREEAPEAVEVISYGIPTFDLNGRHMIHFAGYKGHLGLYPTPHGMAGFDVELATYPRGKGSVQFPHDRPLPVDLVRRIVRHRVAFVLSKPPKKTKA
jgi:uncharacterized protein YdhG (YjbR/CyaY superfamily)